MRLSASFALRAIPASISPVCSSACRKASPAQSAEDERWRSLCERAGNEQDLERRIELVREINRMLIDWLLEQKDRLNLIPSHRSPILPPVK